MSLIMTRSTHSVYLPCEKRPLRRLSRFWAILSTIKNHLMAALNHNSDFFTAESSIVFDNVIKTPDLHLVIIQLYYTNFKEQNQPLSEQYQTFCGIMSRFYGTISGFYGTMSNHFWYCSE